MEMAPLPSATQETPVERAHYVGDLGDLYLLTIKNLVLSILTLGLYRFWATTETRKFVWKNLRLWGDPLEYTGTGGELFLGFLKAILLALPLVIVSGITAIYSHGSELATLALYLPWIFLYFCAGFSARRYRLSRTLWRGIRFGQHGSAIEYAALQMKNLFLMAITLGFYVPYANMSTMRYVWNRTQLGNRDFDFEGDGSKLFGSFAVAWLLLLPTLGLSVIWYQAAEMRHVASRLRLGSLRFRTTVTGGQLFVFGLANAFILMFTLGLGQPIVFNRMIRFFCDNLELHGSDPSSEQLSQSSATRPSTGEGLLDILDADVA